MGIGPEPEKLIRSLPLPPAFAVCELGSQIWHEGNRKAATWWWKPARELYEELGCSRYESLDANGRGTRLCDLNLPLHHLLDLFGRFDLVTDFGTSEHIFNIAQAWDTMHALCKPGGIVAFDKPAEGYPDHGFYNVNRTWLLDIAGANNYELGALLEVPTPRGILWRGWFRKGEEAPFRYPVQGKYKRKLSKFLGT